MKRVPEVLEPSDRIIYKNQSKMHYDTSRNTQAKKINIFKSHPRISACAIALCSLAFGGLVYSENTTTDWLGHPDRQDFDKAEKELADMWTSATPEQKIRGQFIDPITVYVPDEGSGFMGVITPSDHGDIIAVTDSSTCMAGTPYIFSSVTTLDGVITLDPALDGVSELTFIDDGTHLEPADPVTESQLGMLDC